MRVAVCDYNLSFLEEMKECLRSIESLTDIDVYSEKKDFVKNKKTDKKYDLVFLNENWGIYNHVKLEFGERIYSIIDNIPVVLLIDTLEEKKQISFLLDLKVIGCLIKPVDERMLINYIKEIKDRFVLDSVSFSSRGKIIRLYPNEIIHIESHNHKINIYTADEIYDVYEKISDVKRRLSAEFVQCHKSFLVNLNYISSVEGKKIKVKNGKEIPISRGYQNLFHEKFSKYIEQEISL